MTYWVHQKQDANTYNPPVPKLIPGKGFATYYVEFDDAVLQFASLDELRVCILTLSQKVLPSNLILSRKRGGGYGPSNHWLNRIPVRAMTWPYRQRVVKYLVLCLKEFEETDEKEPIPSRLKSPLKYRRPEREGQKRPTPTLPSGKGT